jgi:hypothetical protein
MSFLKVKQYKKNDYSRATRLLKMGSMGCCETSVATSVRYVTSQKGEDIVYAVVKALNHAWRQYLPLKCRDVFTRLQSVARDGVTRIFH